ncbi:MAG TPA: hypothetical protein V6D16_07295, partial [Candidatus Obscuribacterales bacterium]
LHQFCDGCDAKLEVMDTPPLHTLNSLSRFSDRAVDYAKYRPSYPEAAVVELAYQTNVYLAKPKFWNPT